ncbi:MAG: 30S ribosomal protein S6 [Actinomycetia bacterium]|nr:30S ribosomal protein S6 [Actinomycetes bacterium]
MKNYELALVLDPSLDDKGIDEQLSKITKIIEEGKSKVDDVDKWGIKKLAYPIKKQENGFYCFVYFQAEGELLDELDRVNRINDLILRQLIIKRDQ